MCEYPCPTGGILEKGGRNGGGASTCFFQIKFAELLDVSMAQGAASAENKPLFLKPDSPGEIKLRRRKL
jgi:hypothetical protein